MKSHVWIKGIQEIWGLHVLLNERSPGRGETLQFILALALLHSLTFVGLLAALGIGLN
jgi:hypothetical protein